MIHAIAIDDEPIPLTILSKYCDQIASIKLNETFTSTTEAKEYLSHSDEINLLFLDIDMPEISGIDFFKSMKKQYMVIFTTAHMKYAVEGFELNAIDYLLKPFSFDRFQQAITKAIDFSEFERGKITKEIFVKSDYNVIKISLDNTLYIEAYSDYLKIHINNNSFVVTRMTMKAIEAILPKNFIRIHRSYIVNISKISKFSSKEVEINDKMLPIGKTYTNEVFEILAKNSSL